MVVQIGECSFRISHTLGIPTKSCLTSFHLGYRPKLGRKERGGAQKGEGSEPQCVKYNRVLATYLFQFNGSFDNLETQTFLNPIFYVLF